MDDMYDSDDLEYSASNGSDEVGFMSGEDAQPAKKPDPACQWTVIDQNKLQHVQREVLESVTNIIGCTTSVARILLIYFQWNTEALFGTLAEKGEDYAFRVARVTSRSSETPTPSGNDATVCCGTCFCNVHREEATGMECGHIYCNVCWRQHYRIQITEGHSKRLGCMGVRCGAVCDDNKVRRLIQDDCHLLQKFERALMDSYIEDNKRVKWCPSAPHCGHALQIEGEPYVEPICSCGVQFCFNCTEEPHSPCTCEMWKLWMAKQQGDSENKNWLTANTKPCPKCSYPVEKAGGCNHVSCRCGQSFCWLCGAATGRDHTWTSISGHSCGRYKEDQDKIAEEAARNLTRFLHYQARWEGHMQSQRLEAKQTSYINATIQELEKHSTTLKDYSWLSQALGQLFVARRILGYSYVFAYYMFGNLMFKDEISMEQNQLNQHLFEDSQETMEMEVERLSKLIETPPDQLKDELRLSIINSAVNIDKRIVKLYDLIENDLLGSLQVSVNYVAPYKGESTLRACLQPEQLRLDNPGTPGQDEAGASPSTVDALDATDLISRQPSGGARKRVRS